MRLILVVCLVMLEAPFDPIRRQMNSVLLTVDLTKAVADEAIERKDCVVVAYRVSNNQVFNGQDQPPDASLSSKIPSSSKASNLSPWPIHNSNPC